MQDRFAQWWGRLDKRLFAVLVTTVVVRLVWIATVNAQPVSDFLFYFLRSAEVAAGQGLPLQRPPHRVLASGLPVRPRGVLQGVRLDAGRSASRPVAGSERRAVGGPPAAPPAGRQPTPARGRQEPAGR